MKPTLVLVVVCLSLAACSRPISYGVSSPNPSPNPSPSTSPTPALAAGTTFGGADNGHTVTVRTGQQFRVVLDSTYWTFPDQPGSAVVRAVNTPTYQPSPGCVPGEGCGTATASFTAVAPGSVTITASRTSCGEAMACTGTAGEYSVTVVVTS
jgi:hypothetical protein